MHIFRLSLKAGHDHPTYAEGDEMNAICMTDSSETEKAQEMAWARLGELGWAEATTLATVLLPEDPDISGFNDALTQAYHDAKRLGVALIVYPEHAGAA